MPGVALLLLAMVYVGAPTDRASAATPTTINLGTAAAASVLAGTGVTNTGSSVLALDVDTYPTLAITGFPPGETLGTLRSGGAVAQAAQTDLTTAYNAAASATSTNNETGVNLGGQTLTSGVYTASSGMTLNGPLPLILSGTAASVFIFQAGSTLITGTSASVVLTGGATACNVFWQVGSSATIGTTTTFVGNILALTSITVNTGASVDGRALASNGAVTLQDNAFASPICGGATLAISVPSAVNLGSVPIGTTSLSDQLGPVTVTASGLVAPSFTATVSTTTFTTGSGGPNQTIATSLISYWSGPATTTTGLQTAVPGQVNAALAQNLSASQTAFSSTGLVLTITTTWNPTIVITIPTTAVAGTYTGTITHSVA
jgi:hypothetical protein